MTGHIPGTTVLRRHSIETADTLKGANQVGLRASNERLVLSLIRTHGQLSKAQIAELSGLTAQTASVICRGLLDAGLLNAGARVAGKVGQPYVPLSLNPDGAMFFGLRLDEREARLALINFTGAVIEERAHALSSFDLKSVTRFTRDAVNQIRSGYDMEQKARIQGLGVSIASGIRQGRSGLPWREIDEAFAELGRSSDLATFVSSDAIAACSAELIYGLGAGISDFAYVFIDDAVSGGLVQRGNIRFARNDAGTNMSRILVPDGNGGMAPLGSLAGTSSRKPTDAESLEPLARGIAYALHSASSVVHYDLAIVDGAIPSLTLRHIVLLLRGILGEFDDGVPSSLSVREGSRARKGAVLGPACLPLADRFYPGPSDNISVA